MTHEHLTPYGTLPLNKNMEGNNGPESPGGVMAELGSRGVRHKDNPNRSRGRGRGRGGRSDEEIERDEIDKLSRQSPEENLSETSATPTESQPQQELLDKWLNGRKIEDLQAAERDAIMAAVEVGASPEVPQTGENLPSIITATPDNPLNAVWKSQAGEYQVRITGRRSRGADGREYISATSEDGRISAVPVDELEGVQIPQAQTGGGGGIIPPGGPPEAPTAAPAPEPENEEDRNNRWMREYMDLGYELQEAAEMVGRGISPPKREEDDSGDGDELDPNERKRLNAEGRAQNPTAAEMLKNFAEAVNEAKNLEQFSEGAKKFLRSYVHSFRDESFNEEQTYMQRFEEIVNNDNLGTAKVQLTDLMTKLGRKFTFIPEGQREAIPESFDEFIDLVIDKEGDDYGPGGRFELKDKDGKMRYENVSAWAWSKMFWWDGFSPDDPNLNFFSVVSINLNYRAITLNDFLTDKRYKKGSVTKRLINRDGTERLVKSYEDNKEYAQMVDKLTDEIWYFSQDRKFGVNYRLNMGQDKTLLEQAVGPMLASNTFTRSGGFETLFSLSGISGDKYLNSENSVSGEMAAVAENVYDKIFDIDELQSLLGEESTFFRRDFLKSDDNKLELAPDPFDKKGRLVGKIEDGVKKGRGKTTIRGVDKPIIWDEDWYDENGVLKLREDGPELDWRRGKFLDYMNIFNEKIKDTYIIEEVRERIRQSLVEKMLESKPGLLDSPINKDTGITNPNGYLYKRYSDIFGEGETEKIKHAIIQAIYHDATKAEMVAFYTTMWFGIAAMNDTTATGFNVGTKWSQTRAYRTGQGREDTIGTDLGNEKTIGIYGRVIVPVKEGLRVRSSDPKEKGDILQRVIDNIAKNAFKTVDITKEDGEVIKKSLAREEAKKLRFNSNAMSTLWEDHVARGAPVYEQLAEGQEFNIDKIVQWDFVKGFTSDTAEVTKQLKEKMKQRRYLLSGYGETDYGEDMDVYTQRGLSQSEKEQLAKEMGVGIEDVPSYRIINDKAGAKLGTEMLGKQVWWRRFTNKKTGDINWKEGKDSVRENKRAVWKEAFLVELGAGIAAHIDRFDLSSPMGYMQLVGFFDILKKLPADIDVNENDLRKTRGVYAKAFSKEMIEYVKDISGARGFARRYLASEAGKGLAKGIWDALKIFVGGFK